MAAVAYPSTLPCPRAAPFVPADRVRRSDLPGLTQFAGKERDFRGAQDVTFTFSATQAAEFDTWWRSTLLRGGLWFSAGGWPLPPSWSGDAVRRFAAPPQWSAMGAGYWSVTARVEVRGRGLPPRMASLVDADLLVHFDEANADEWEDWSVNQRALTIHPAANSSIEGGATGRFAGAGQFEQFYIGTSSNPSLNNVTFIEAEGRIDFGNREFFISCVVNIDFALPASGLMICLSSRGPVNPGPSGSQSGWAFGIARDLTNTLNELLFVYVTSTGTTGVVRGGTLTSGLKRIAVTRKNGPVPGLDVFSLIIEDQFVQTGTVGASTAILTPTEDRTLIGAYDNSTGAGSAPNNVIPRVVNGFHGIADEFYIVSGPGTGLYAGDDITPPEQPYGD